MSYHVSLSYLNILLSFVLERVKNCILVSLRDIAMNVSGFFRCSFEPPLDFSSF